MPVSASLSALPSRSFTPAAARHLLERSGFGGSPVDIAETAKLGLTKAVRKAVRFQETDASALPEPELDPDVMRPPTAEERQAFVKARRSGDEDAQDAFRRARLKARGDDRKMHAALQRWWLTRMFDTPRVSEEKLVLLWHSHFATRHRDVRDAYLMWTQQQTFRQHANGSFADLAAAMVRDPAMIIFLNNDRNISRRPNENLAREFMELFTLGEGQYSEDDIKQAARALTGYHRQDNDFVFRRLAHDGGEKTILGQTDDFDGDSFVELLLRHKATSRFIALKLYRHYVADVPEYLSDVPADHAKAVEALAEELLKNKYELTPTLETLFASEMFFDAGNQGNKIKSPAHLIAGTARNCETPHRGVEHLVNLLGLMGQDLFEPPSVAGWDGGRAWINTSTLFDRQNACVYLLTGKDPRRNWKVSDLRYDPTPLLEGLPDDKRTPDGIVNHLCDAMLGERVGADRRASLVTFMKDRDGGVTPSTLTALLVLITAMPEYQLC